MRIFFVISVLSILFMSSGFSQEQPEALVISLEDAKAIAYDNNLKLQDQALDVAIAKSQIEQTKAQGLPQINANFDYQWNILNAFSQRTTTDEDQSPPDLQGEYDLLQGAITQPELTGVPERMDISGQVQGVAYEAIGGFFNSLGDAFVARHQSNAGVSVNQLLFDGVYLLGLEATKVYVELSEVQMEPTKRDIEKTVEKAYYGALVTQQSIDIVDKNMANLSKLIYETTEIYKAGFAEQLDIDRLSLSLSNLKNTKKNLIKLSELNYELLNNALNIPLDTELQLTDDVEKFEEYALSQEILNSMADAELWPEFQIFDVQEKLQHLDIKRIEKGKLPKVNAFLNGGYNYQGGDFIFTNGFDGWFPNLAAGLSVSMPIFDGGLKKNQIKQKEIELEKIRLSKKTLEYNIGIQVENAMTSFANARTDIQMQRESIALAEKIYNTTQIKYREGVGSSVELYQAQQELYSAQQGYINSLYDLLIAKVDLEKALGK